MIPRFFKYMPVDTAMLVLGKRTLRWSAPDLFNDPFEFKSPFALGFEWDDVEKPFYDEFSRVVTQASDPPLAPADKNSAVAAVLAARGVYKGADPAVVIDKVRAGYPAMLKRWKEGAEEDRQTWELWKHQYRVLCFSAVSDNILMWSHYAKKHEGVVFAFEPKLELDSALLAARPVFYSREVPNAGTLAEFVKYVTGQWPQPSRVGIFEKSVFAKSVFWAYENEWRVLDKEATSGPDLHSDRPFDPRELVAIYFGCRTPQAAKTEIIAAAKALGTPVSFFEMRDERIRFELTPMPIAP
jgi:Protein of unknown function (DUF2971)